MPRRSEPKMIRISDPRAIRALAHPARLRVLEALYDRREAMTATQLAELADITPSAMSYHLRSLERFGIIRRSDGPGDGRERPWERAGAHLAVSPGPTGSSSAGVSATGALVAYAMERDREKLLAAQRRVTTQKGAVPLDAFTSYNRFTLILTDREARELTTQMDALLKTYLEENRPRPAKEAGRLSITILLTADPEHPGESTLKNTRARSR